MPPADTTDRVRPGAALARVPVEASAPRSPPASVVGPLAWLRSNLFSSWLSTAVTLLLAYLIVRWTVGFVEWAFVNAIWEVPNRQTQACRDIKGVGACWAVVTEKHRFILFGTYPFEEHWRPALVVLLFVGLYVVSALRRFWRKELVMIWVGVLTLIGILMWGGNTAPGLLRQPYEQLLALALLAGAGLAYLRGRIGVAVPSALIVYALLAWVGPMLDMPYVSQERWGGLPITLILATFGLAFAFPLAILVALGRRSEMPAIRMLCVLYVELIRGVPLISLLFMASVMFPLFLPEGINIDKLLRAQIAITLFAGAYLAEVVRGGLQALPRGQYEAADALGLTYWQKTGLIVLPQALRLVIPPLVNTFIGFFKDTSLVLIIGIFDLLTAGKTAIIEPAWQGFGVEVYIFVGLIYFMFCFAMSKYSQNLEAELNRHRRR
jgi:general L-amino acid transport system permease protein